MKARSAAIVAVLSLSTLCYAFVGYFLNRQNFLQYISTYLLLFTGFIFLWKKYSPANAGEGIYSLKFLLIVSVFFRIIFLFSVPSLSDDFYRFLWDGKMFATGQNPFTIIPSFYILFSDEHNNFLWSLYSKMNSQDYYTIYPPVAQFIFGLAGKLFSENIIGNIVVIRLVCIAAEIGNIILIQKLLKHFELPSNNALLYALNPLVIIELSGNLHLEAVMIFFLLLSILLLLGRKNMLSAIAMALAIATKLIPLLFLPFLIRRLGLKKSTWYFFTCALTLLLLFLPFINKELIEQYGSSLNLYFQHFEFNASLFYLTRWLGFEIKGYDIIQSAGPIMGVITFLSVIALMFFEKQLTLRHFLLSMQWALTIYLLMTTTVHPWYITTLVMLSVFTLYRYSMIWSLLIALSYATYQTLPYKENLWFTAFEYMAVIGVLSSELLSSEKPEANEKPLSLA